MLLLGFSSQVHTPTELEEARVTEVLRRDAVFEEDRGHLGGGLLDAEHLRNLLDNKREKKKRF